MNDGLVAFTKEDNIILSNNVYKEKYSKKYNETNLYANIDDRRILKELSNIKIKLQSDIIVKKTVELDDRIIKLSYTKLQSDGKTKGYLLILSDITKIRKLENVRSEFVSNVTHELKTPLTSIRGFIDTLKSGAKNDEKVREKFLDIIDVEACRLSFLIEDILRLGEIEDAGVDKNIYKNSVKEILEEVISIVEVYRKEKNITLDINISEDMKYMMINRDRLKQLLINLIENAIKYNKDNGNVLINIKRDENDAILEVIDTGIGISKEDVTRIFERFYRVNKGRSRKLGGTGLGLSIVKHIVNLYNGDISVESELDRGTTIIVRLTGVVSE